MSQKGTNVKVLVGLESTADGAGSTATTLNLDDNFFKVGAANMTELVGASITNGTWTTTVASITDANTCELTAAQSWSDGAAIWMVKVAPVDQTAMSRNFGADTYDITSKDDAGVRARKAAVRRKTFQFAANYKNDNLGQVMCIIAVLNAVKLRFTLQNTATGVSADDYTGSCLCSQFGLSQPHDGKIDFTAQFTATGAVTGPA